MTARLSAMAVTSKMDESDVWDDDVAFVMLDDDEHQVPKYVSTVLMLMALAEDA